MEHGEKRGVGASRKRPRQLTSSTRRREAAGSDNAGTGIESGQIRAAKCIKMLVDDGADLDARDPSGLSALMIAAGGCKAKVVDTLINDCKVSVLATDLKGRTALMHAAGSGNVDIVKKLVDSGGQKLLAAKSNGGWTALKYAAFRGDKDMFDALVQAQEDPDFEVPDSNGLTCLMYAAKNRNLEMVCGHSCCLLHRFSFLVLQHALLQHDTAA